VKEEDDLMITNCSGIVIRMPVSDIRVMGRATQGVRVINLQKKDSIADVTVVVKGDDVEDDVIASSEEETKSEIDPSTDTGEDTSADTGKDTRADGSRDSSADGGGYSSADGGRDSSTDEGPDANTDETS